MELQAAVDALRTESENDYFNQHAQQVVNAALDKKDFIVSNEFHKTCGSLVQPEKLVHLYNLLSCVALTNSVLKINEKTAPDDFFETVDLKDEK